MLKYPIPIIILVLIPFFIIPVNAQFTNGDFETGDMTGWTTALFTATNDNPHNGGYAAHLDIYQNGGSGNTEDTSYFYQTHDLTNVDSIGFWYNTDINFIGGTYLDTRLYVDIDRDNSYEWELINTDNGINYFYIEVDTSSITGSHDIEFGGYYAWNNAQFYIDYNFDDITMQLQTNNISYNPDIPVSNTKPFNLSYTLNSTYANNPSYCEIYSYTGTDIGNETHPNIIWLRGFEGYVNQASGYFITSDYFHSYQWPDLNETYGIGLFSPGGAHPGIRFPDIETDPNYLSHDQIYVHYNYSYPTPTPQPTPNMTAIPTPSGTPTPQPSATPQPDPETLNESLNTSFKQGYSNLVNTTIDGFYEPIYNFTYYIASPLLGINDTLYNFSIHMNESFTNSSSSLILSSSILFLIMINIPDKLINVMTYYLIWLIVLLIFKGDA